MAIVINNPSTPEDSSSAGVIIGVILGILLIILFFVYGLPVLRSTDKTPANTTDTSNLNVKVDLPGSTAGGAAPGNKGSQPTYPQ